MKLTIIFFTLIFSSGVFGQTLDVSLLYPEKMKSECQFKRCFSLDEVTQRAGNLSYDTQNGLLELFEARQKIKVRAGELLPSFNLRIDNPVNVFDYVPNMVGFLFPSNWFRLKESKLHAAGQTQSFVSLVANQKNMAKGLYLASHQELSKLAALLVHEGFVKEISGLMQERFDQGSLAQEDLEEVKSFLNKIEADLINQKNYIRELNSDISFLIKDDEVFNETGPQTISLPDLSKEKPIDPASYASKVIERSPELLSLTYLIEAARFSKKARSYEFLTPDSGPENAFGFGYKANLNIAKAEVEKVKNAKKAFEANLKRALVKLSSQLNSSIQIYELSVATEKSMKYILQSLLEDLTINSQIDINRFLMIISENLSNQQTKSMAQHNFLQSKAQLERLLMEGKLYESIAAGIPSMKDKALNCSLRKENIQIKKALDAGELKLPSAVTFDKEELKFCI